MFAGRKDRLVGFVVMQPMVCGLTIRDGFHYIICLTLKRNNFGWYQCSAFALFSCNNCRSTNGTHIGAGALKRGNTVSESYSTWFNMEMMVNQIF